MPVVLNGNCGDHELGRAFLTRVARHFSNEMAAVTPNGEMLSHDPDEGLKKWKALPKVERTTLADLGAADPVKEPPPGGLILNVYTRALQRDEGGRLAPYQPTSLVRLLRNLEPGRDHLWLTAAEAKALVPDTARLGVRQQVPVAVADRICRYCLIDLVRVGGNGGPRRSDEVLSRKLWLTVEEAAPTGVRLRLDGSARLATRDPSFGTVGGKLKVDDYQLTGVLFYDGAKKSVTRFDVVAFSETGHYDEIDQKTLPLGVAFELSRGDTPSNRFPPSSYGKDYFNAKGR